MPHVKKKITLVAIAALITITGGIIVLAEKTNLCIDKKIESVIDRQLDSDPRIGVCISIKEDIEEIRLILAFMNKDNPEYKKTVEVIRSTKK